MADLLRWTDGTVLAKSVVRDLINTLVDLQLQNNMLDQKSRSCDDNIDIDTDIEIFHFHYFLAFLLPLVVKSKYEGRLIINFECEIS